MAGRKIAGFLACERGGGTVLGLIWFILLVGICGLAVDITDGFRNRTMLQATADAAALAGAMDVRDENAAVASAVAYSEFNMPGDRYGATLKPGDVEVGVWDEENRTFASSGFPEGTLLNAVRVTLNQTAANDNPVPVNFLRIVGLTSWDVRTMAVAQAFHPKCLRNGLTAANIVNISSNNNFVKEICVHGEQGVEMQNHNYFEAGTTVSMLDLADLTLPSGGMESNPGLTDALAEESKYPRLVGQVDQIMSDFLDPSSELIPAYIDRTKPVIVVDDKFDLSTVQPHRIYHVDCKANKAQEIPSNSVIQRVVIISDCAFKIGAGSLVFDAVIGSRSGGGTVKDKGKAIVDVPSGAVLGLPDNCARGGGVQIFSNATIKFSSSTTFNGVQMVAAGDIDLGAQAMGINGISAQAGGDINMTSNNSMGLCQGGVPMLRRFAYWRLVR